MKPNDLDFGNNVLDFFQRHKLHPDLSLVKGGMVLIKRHDIRPDELEKEFAVLDLKAYTLPVNSIYNSPVALLSRDDLVCAVILSLGDAILRVKSDKRRHSRIQLTARICIKFFEYFWLNNFLRLCDIAMESTHTFAQCVALGGWYEALNIESRIYEVLGDSQGSAPLSKREFAKRMVTNIRGSSFNPIYHRYILLSFEDAEPLAAQPLGLNSVVQVFSAINFLYSLPEGIGLKHYPYPNYYVLAKKLTAAPSRTPNIGPKDAARLFAGSFEILLNYADNVALVIRDVASLVINNHQAGRFELGHGIESVVRRLQEPSATRSLN